MPQLTLKAVRVNAGYNQSQFAKLLGVSVGTIKNWENGRSEPTANQLRSISHETGIDMDFIFIPQKTK